MLKKMSSVAAAAFLSACTSMPEQTTPQKTILGYKHPAAVKIAEHQFSCPAKLDTGAKTTSLHAEHIQHDKKAGIVTFEIGGLQFSEPVIREANIKKPTKEQSDKRPVILINLSIAGQTIETEASLNNREDFNRPLLIGRDTMTPLGIILDPSIAIDAEPLERRKCDAELKIDNLALKI